MNTKQAVHRSVPTLIAAFLLTVAIALLQTSKGTPTSATSLNGENDVPVLNFADHQSQFNNGIKILPHGRWFLDQSQVRTIEDIQRIKDWQGKGVPENFGVKRGVLWINLQFDYNLSDTTQWILDLGVSPSQQSIVFLVSGSSITELRPQSVDASNQNNNLVGRQHFPLRLIPNQDYQLFIKISSSGLLSSPAMLWPESVFYQNEMFYQFFNGIYYGVIFLLGVYSFAIGAIARNWSYVYFALFATCTAQLVASKDGIGFFWFWPESIYWSAHNLVILAWLSVSASLLVTVNFFEKRKEIQPYDRMFHVAIISSLVVAAIMAFFDQTSTLVFSHFAVLVINLIVLALSIQAWRNQCRYARFYLLAFLFLVLSQLAWLAADFAIIDQYSMQIFAPKFFLLVGIIFIRLALTDKQHELTKEHMEAQEQAVIAVALQRKAQNRLSFVESHDLVTGMPNRLALKQRYISVRKNKPRFGLALIRLSRFEEINTALGRSKADSVLIALAAKMEQEIERWVNLIPIEEDGDLVNHLAHIGGVSFAFIFDLEDGSPTIKQNAMQLVNQLRMPVSVHDFRVDPHVALGITVIENGLDFSSAMQQAQAACDYARNLNSAFATYRDSMDPYGSRRLTLTADLRVAAREGQLSLTYQPQIHADTHEISGFEALIRWQHPQLGAIAPSEFLILAEQSEVIGDITNWVIDQSLLTLAKIHEKGYKVKMGVNLSARNLTDKRVIDRLEECRQKYDLKARFIVLEITETAMLEQSGKARAHLDTLFELGYVVAIDDFGTGYSSLTYLKELPVKELKIDKSFTQELKENSHDFVIVQTTISMAKKMNIKVVVEGIEQVETMELLEDVGADYFQGYFISQPIQDQDLFEWLSDHHPLVEETNQ